MQTVMDLWRRRLLDPMHSVRMAPLECDVFDYLMEIARKNQGLRH